MAARFVCRASNTWLSRCAQSQRLSLGLTARGLEQIGDITFLRRLAQPERGTVLAAGSPLVEVGWDGHRISNADELYHTIYEYVEGSTVVSAPASAGAVRLLAAAAEIEPPAVEDDEIGPDTPLAEFELLDGAAGWERVRAALVPEHEAYDDADDADDDGHSVAFERARLQEPVAAVAGAPASR